MTKRQCPICQIWFSPKPSQKICGKKECKKTRHQQQLRANIEANRERYEKKWREASKRRATGVGAGKYVRNLNQLNIQCPWCTYWNKPGKLYCSQCEREIDMELAEKKRQKKSGYWDIVKENARRAGKDPAQEVRRIRKNTFGHINFWSKVKKTKM